MGTFKTKFNPFAKSLQWVLDANLLKIKGSVDTKNDLPLTGNSENDCYIVKDTDRLYTWGISASSGTLDDWKDVGSSTEVDWSAITNKPSSSVINIDDAVDKKHEQGTDQKLDEGGVNEVAVVDVKDAVDKKHEQNTDTKLDENGTNEISASELVKNVYNVVLLAFKVAVQESLTLFNLVDGTVDEYEDENGIDTSSSINESYDSVNDLYSPTKLPLPTNTELLLHLNGVDGATSTSDSSINDFSIDFIGDAEIDNTEKKWGNTSCYFAGSSSPSGYSYLYVGDTSDFDFGSDNWTMEFQLMFESGYTSDPYSTFFAKYDPVGWKFNMYNSNLNFTGQFTAWQDLKWAWTPTVGIWYHIAVVRNGTTITCYVDGVSLGDKTGIVGALHNETSRKLEIGNYAGDGGAGQVKGWMDEILITTTAKYTSNFTKPSLPYEAPNNMTLISEPQSAESEPDSARIVILEEDVDSITLNTDLKAYISKDDGSTWAEATLSNEGNYDTSKKVLVANADLSLSGIGSGTDMVYKLVTDNEKDLKIHGTSLLWD